jgi:hypothetical protein
VLRESGFATVRPEGVRRLYAIAPEPLENAAAWFDPFRRFWQPHLDALGTELARGRRQRRLQAERESDVDIGEAGTAEPDTAEAGTAEPEQTETTESQED